MPWASVSLKRTLRARRRNGTPPTARELSQPPGVGARTDAEKDVTRRLLSGWRRSCPAPCGVLGRRTTRAGGGRPETAGGDGRRRRRERPRAAAGPRRGPPRRRGPPGRCRPLPSLDTKVVQTAGVRFRGARARRLRSRPSTRRARPAAAGRVRGGSSPSGGGGGPVRGSLVVGARRSTRRTVRGLRGGLGRVRRPAIVGAGTSRPKTSTSAAAARLEAVERAAARTPRRTDTSTRRRSPYQTN